MANRKSEKMMLVNHAAYHYNLNSSDPPPIEHPDGGGSHFQIMKTNNGESTMTTEIVKRGSLMNLLYLFHVDTIHSELAVVPELGKDGCITNCECLDGIQLELFEMALNDNESSECLSSLDSHSDDSTD
eukprot:jgi/Psemu1/15032/gm1.15032_g